jgi:glycosidase
MRRIPWRRVAACVALLAVVLAGMVVLNWAQARWGGSGQGSVAGPAGSGDGGQGSISDDDGAALVPPPFRSEAAGQQFYFVMTDRFANGDSSNDAGGLGGGGLGGGDAGEAGADKGGDRLTTGFDPTDPGFFHGGDLAGLRERLDYIQGLGTTAIWLTPSFVNKVFQGDGENASAGYHGYWVTDFTQIDPHFGTNEELQELISDAHGRGIKVYFDIITNHTADVIRTSNGDYAYRPTSEAPYTPVVDPAEAHIKSPEWLNDPSYYHNRGDTTWEGESVTYGDFGGLDDLNTEDPRVVNGFVDVYSTWVDIGIDGFRIDTVKHVNFEFWEAFTQGIHEHAVSVGKPDFFMFGEVYDGDPGILSRYPRNTDMNAVLDFGFQGAAVAFARGGDAGGLQQLFRNDDFYTTPHSSASELPTFLGNHDMGRAGYLLGDAADPPAALRLAHDLMFLTRGQPVVYYGDEQGFAGTDGDKDSRQDMFATQVPGFAAEALVDGTPFGTQGHFNLDAWLYQHIAALARLRADHPALVSGTQSERWADPGQGVYATSRVAVDVPAAERIEYVVAFNNSTEPRTIEPTLFTPDAHYSVLWGEVPEAGAGSDITTGPDGKAQITVPGMSTVVLMADQPVGSGSERWVNIVEPQDGVVGTGLNAIAADIDDATWALTAFSWRVAGASGDGANGDAASVDGTSGDGAGVDDPGVESPAQWQPLGTAETTDPRVFHDTSGIAPGTQLEYRAITMDTSGTTAQATTTVTVQ